MMTHLDWSMIAPRVCYALLHFLWQGLLVYAIWGALLPLMRRASTRYVFSLLALTALAICPIYTFTHWVPAATEAAGRSTFVEGIEANVRQLASNWGWQAYVVAVWSVGVSLMSFKLMLGYAGLVRLRRGLAPIAANTLPGIGRWRDGLRRQVEGRLFATERVREAVVVGFYRPMILIPASWLTEMPAEMLEAVIAHEVAHIRRFDLWINLLQRFLETVLFYHPVVWLISKRARWERELCCDEMAVATTGERLTYVDALSWVASRSVVANRPLFSAAILGDRKMRLLARVKNVLQMNESGERTTWWAAAVLALALPLTAWVVAGAQERDKDRNKRDDSKAERRERDRDRDDDRKVVRRDREDRERREHRERDDVRRDRDARDHDARDRDLPRRVELRRRVEKQHDREHEHDREHARRDDHAREHSEADHEPRLGLGQIQQRIREFSRGLELERARYERAIRARDEAARRAKSGERRTIRKHVVRRDEHADTHVHGHPNDDLVKLISDLKREVQELRREVHELRNQRGHDRERHSDARREPIRRDPNLRELGRIGRPVLADETKAETARRGTIRIFRGKKPEVEQRVIEYRLDNVPKSESRDPRVPNESRRRIIRREETLPENRSEFKGFKLRLDPTNPPKKVQIEGVRRVDSPEKHRPQEAVIELEIETESSAGKKRISKAPLSEAVLKLVKKKEEGKRENKPERRVEKKEVRRIEIKKEEKPRREEPKP